MSLYHYTNAQFSSTKRISRDQAKAGDLVFFFNDLHHMGMVVGNGMMVHAPHSGDVVRMAPLDQMPIAGFGRPG